MREANNENSKLVKAQKNKVEMQVFQQRPPPAHLSYNKKDETIQRSLC